MVTIAKTTIKSISSAENGFNILTIIAANLLQYNCSAYPIASGISNPTVDVMILSYGTPKVPPENIAAPKVNTQIGMNAVRPKYFIKYYNLEYINVYTLFFIFSYNS